jgi:uncharacterized membrane protein
MRQRKRDWNSTRFQFRSAAIIVVLLCLGMLFRVANFDQEVYWVDEVATSIRISGYTKQEVTQQLASRSILSLENLQYYQHINPDRGWLDTFGALTQSPEHAPFYFLLARFWAQFLGSSVAVIRSLSVAFSLLALPCLYWLCRKLFTSPPPRWIAVGLLAVSPFFVAYAQEARPYSLWSLTLLLSSGSFLQAMRRNTWTSWSIYTSVLAVSLYTSLLSMFVVIGQGIYAIALDGFRFTLRVRTFLIAALWGLVAFAPWLIVIAQHWQLLENNTTWTQEPIDLWVAVGIWLYSLVIPFFDVPVSADLTLATLTKGVVALMVLAVIVYSFYFICSRATRRIWLFIVTFSCSTPLALIGIDLIRNGQASATPRYLIPCQLGVILALAYLLGHSLNDLSCLHRNSRRIRIAAAGMLISVSLVSCLWNLNRTPDYQKARSQANPAIASIVNQTDTPLIIAEPELAIDVLSLSYELKPSTNIQILSRSESTSVLAPCNQLFLLNPSSNLQATIQSESRFRLDKIYQPDLLRPNDTHLSLWQLIPSDQAAWQQCEK